MNRQILPILLINFIGILGYSIVIPILVFMVNDMGGNGVLYGILASLYPGMQLIGAPILGRLSDNIGRRKVLLISQAGTFVAWLLFIIALSIPVSIKLLSFDISNQSYLITLPLFVLAIARALDGFTGGNISVANAYLADISSEEDRELNFGKMSASTSLGFVIGPALAGILGTTLLGNFLPVSVAAIISLGTMILIIFWLPESKDSGEKHVKRLNLKTFFSHQHKDCSREKPQKTSLSDILKIPQTNKYLLVYFLTFFGFSLFYTGFPLYVSGTLDWNSSSLGTYLAFSSIIMFLVQTYGIRYVHRYFDSMKTMILGALLLSLGFIIMSLNISMLWLYTANVLFSVGNGLMWPSFMGLFSGLGNKGNQGAIMGWGASMGSLGSILGLLAGGFLFQEIHTLVFMFSGIIFVLIIIINLWDIFRKAGLKYEDGKTQAKPIS